MTLVNRQATTEAPESFRQQQRDVSLSALGGALNVIKKEILTRRDADSVASARCTFVYTNGIFLHSLLSFRNLLPRNSASIIANILKP
jgi:hypothetical protein